MDFDLYHKYKGVKLTKELEDMYAEIIMKDETANLIFRYIAVQTGKAKEPNSLSIGATISDMVNDIVVERPVKMKGKNKYKIEKTKIERKKVERTVQCLLMTGLCYYEQIGRTKVMYCTERGISVLRTIINKQKQKEMEKEYSLNN